MCQKSADRQTDGFLSLNGRFITYMFSDHVFLGIDILTNQICSEFPRGGHTYVCTAAAVNDSNTVVTLCL